MVAWEANVAIKRTMGDRTNTLRFRFSNAECLKGLQKLPRLPSFEEWKKTVIERLRKEARFLKLRGGHPNVRSHTKKKLKIDVGSWITETFIPIQQLRITGKAENDPQYDPFGSCATRCPQQSRKSAREIRPAEEESTKKIFRKTNARDHAGCCEKKRTARDSGIGECSAASRECLRHAASSRRSVQARPPVQNVENGQQTVSADC